MSSPTLKYHPEAAVEATEAVRWYLEHSSIAAISFFDRLRSTEQKVLRSPERWGIYLHGTRICRFRQFPYGLVYQLRDEYILIVAVAHLKRKPGYWKARLPKTK